MAKKKAKKAVTAKKDTQKDSCFVMMPFGGFFDAYYTEIYCPAIEKCGLRPTRADDFFRSSNIVHDIWELTRAAKVILADLTSSNPNVFYELGIAHAITKPAIIISESLDYVPFDLRSLRVIIYNKNVPNWGEKLFNDLINSINETLSSPEKSIPVPFFNSTGVAKKSIDPTTQSIRLLEAELQSLKNQLQSRGNLVSPIGNWLDLASGATSGGINVYNIPPTKKAFISTTSFSKPIIVPSWTCKKCGHINRHSENTPRVCSACGRRDGEGDTAIAMELPKA